jgi:glycosyltransferase involved in cell wall biosynthesis
MHIAIITDSIDTQKAGIHYYTKNLVETLLKIDKKNKYTLIHCKKNDFYKGKNEIIIKEYGRIYEFFRKIFLIPKAVNKLKPDIIIEPAHFGPFRIKKGIKTITIIHDLTNFIYPDLHTLKTNLVHKIFLPKIIKKSDFLITPSKTTKKDIEKVFKRKKNIFICPPSIDKPKIVKEKRLIKDPYFLFIGTIEARKNIDTLVNAFLEIKKEKKIPHKLVIAGRKGWKNKRTFSLMRQSSIKYFGYIDETKKANLLKNAEIFLFPSVYEGFGIPPLEALSYGTPIITSNAGSLGEIFSKISKTHEPKDKKRLKELIIEILENEEIKKHFKKNGPSFAKKFYKENVAKEFLEIIE